MQGNEAWHGVEMLSGGSGEAGRNKQEVEDVLTVPNNLCFYLLMSRYITKTRQKEHTVSRLTGGSYSNHVEQIQFSRCAVEVAFHILPIDWILGTRPVWTCDRVWRSHTAAGLAIAQKLMCHEWFGSCKVASEWMRKQWGRCTVGANKEDLEVWLSIKRVWWTEQELLCMLCRSNTVHMFYRQLRSGQ